MFDYVKDKGHHVTSRWQTRFLSHGGKETLIKSVGYSMPVFSVTSFQLPTEICSEIDSLLSNFWWGSKPNKHKLSWVSWKKLSRSKREGGLGFRGHFNQALLANHSWRILHKPNSLIYRILKSHYFKTSHLLSANYLTRSSFGWQSLQLPVTPPRAPRLTPGTPPTLHVSVLINPTTHQWDDNAIHTYIDPMDHHFVWQIYLRPTRMMDTCLWSLRRDGHFTTQIWL